MDFQLPPVGEGLYEVELIRWIVSPGTKVVRGQGLVEVMSDKATMEVTATFAGTITETLAEPGTKISVGQLLLRYDPAAGSTISEHPQAPREAAPASTASASANGQSITPAAAPTPAVANGAHTHAPLPPAAPSVRHLARQLGIDLARIRGSGPAGRILLKDLSGHLEPAKSPRTSDISKGSTKLDLGTAGTRQKLMGLRRKIAERMVESSRNIPHYSYIDEVEVSDLVRVRSQLKETFAPIGIKLTYLPFIVKAVARALKEVPVVNSTFDEATGEVTMHDHYNIGIAVAAPGGLIVPVIKDADTKDIAAIANEIERLSQDARAGKSRIEDLRGGTFTVTSVGNLGGLISTPIINTPEVGILGIGRIVRRPVYDHQGAIRPADMLYLSFSFDHRIVDGAVGAIFGNAIVKRLTNPAALLLPERYS